MSVRFVIGRAGSGKTHHCLKAVRASLRDHPLEGPALLLLVPEQAGLQMERAIIDPERGIRVAHRAEVVSFQRLAVRVLEQVGARDRVALSEPARAMILRRLLSAHRAELRYYARVARDGRAPARMAGLVERLGRGVSELIEEAVDPAACQRVAEAIASDQSVDAAQRAKVHDLALIYRAYLDYLGDRWLDPARRLELARSHLAACSWLHGAHLWVDGFASFSGQERDTLIELARLAGRVEITLLGDPERSGSKSGPTRPGSYLFAKTRRTLRELQSAIAEAGLTLQAPLLLSPEPPPRFAGHRVLADLERRLFTPGAESASGAPDARRSISLYELPSRRVEVDSAVSCVCAWVQGDGTRPSYRYRDVAIIVRDLDVYQDLLSEALCARHVPHFIDRRRPVTNHPLVELLRSLVAIAVHGMRLDQVRLLLKCGLLPWDRGVLDELENYLLRHGISDTDTWRQERWHHRRDSNVSDRPSGDHEGRNAAEELVDTARRELWRRLSGWIEFSEADKPKTGAAWGAALRRVWGALEVAPQLARLERDAVDRGDLDLAEQLREVWKQVCALIDDLTFVFGDQALESAAIEEVLESGLAQVSLGLVPPMIDQVLVGSIERSRHPDIKAAVVIGFNDGLFPRVAPDDSILDDEDRLRFEAHGLSVGLTERARILDESLLAYIALTRPSEAVVVSWSTADERGRALRHSPYLHALRAAVPGVSEYAVGDPARSRAMWDVLAPGDLTGRMTLEFRRRDRHVAVDDGDTRRWNQLYHLNRRDMSESPVDRRALGALAAHPERSTVPPALIDDWLRGTFRASVSSLESYAACPFQFFAQRVLRLQRREERPLEPIDVGNIHHAVLEDFFAQVASQGAPFEAMSDEELRAALNASCGHIGVRLEGDELLSDARDAYLLSRSARRLARIVRAQRSAAERSRSRTFATELPFGRDEPDALPGLSIITPKGRTAELSGFIDRVDLAELGDELLGIVVDYKTGRGKRLDLTRVYHGLALQLLGYLLVLRDCGASLTGRPIRPGGALFQSLAPEYALVNHPSGRESRDARRRGVARPRGMLTETSLDVLESPEQASWSDHYQFYRKKDGTLGHLESSDAAADGDFGVVLAHVRRRMGELVDGVLDGDVSVRPYRLGSFSPCAWCDMGSVCRFEFGLCDVDMKQSLDRRDVLDRISHEYSDEPS